MSHEHDEAITCAACDLGARLQAELLLARRQQAVTERRFHEAAATVAEGRPVAPFSLLRSLLRQRLEVEALERVLDNMIADQDHGATHAAAARA